MTYLEKLKIQTAWDSAPALTEAELEELLAMYSLADNEGLAPSEEEWKPTYDLNKAAADGWLIKAGRSAETVEVDPPGSGIVTSKVFDNCVRMALFYRKRVRTSVSVR